MIKVLHIGEYVNGGVATYLKTLIKNAKKYNIDIYLMMSYYNSDHNWDIENEKIIYYDYERSVKNILLNIKSIHQKILDVNPNVIHIHSSWAGFIVRVPYLLKKKNIRIIYTPHGWAFLMDVSIMKKYFYAMIEKLLSYVTDDIINISNYEKNMANYFGIPKNKMVMIYNGVDGANVIRNIDFNVDKNKINLLFVGRVDRTKGLDIFINTYEKYDFSNMHLYVIGKGVLDKITLKNNKKTTYLGWVENEKIDFYYQQCDAVIIPSRWEGFGITAIEAMRNSKAIIASNKGALPEIVSGVGYVFNIERENELKNILSALNKNDLADKGNKGYERYRNLFTSQDFCRKTIELELRDTKIMVNSNSSIK